MKLSGWCAILADIDNDGWKDIFTANSHVNDRIGDFQAIAFKQPNSLFLNDGRGRLPRRDGRVRTRPRGRGVTAAAASPISTATAGSISSC